MDYFVALIVALFAASIAYATLNKNVAERIGVLKPKSQEETYTSKSVSRVHVVLITIAIAGMSYFAAFKILSITSSWLGVSKMILAMLCMIGSACVDYREHRIPNVFPAIMAIGGVVFLALGVILRQDGAIAYVTTSVVSAVCCALFLFVAAVLSKQGIGAGDIKLITALALIAGLYTVMGTLLFGIVLCCLVAVVCLITKKKSLSGSLPFGPFLFVGFVISILVGCF